MATGNDAFGFKIAGDYAFVTELSNGVEVVDISDPSLPSIVAHWPCRYRTNDIAISGNYAFVAEWDSGMSVLDISDPVNPTYLGAYRTPGGSAVCIDLDGDHAFTGSYYYPDDFRVIEVFQRHYDLARDEAYSTQLAPGTEIESVRLLSTQTDSIRWEVCADGTNWEDILPGRAWTTLAYPGHQLRWRAGLTYQSVTVDPVCSEVTIDWDETELAHVLDGYVDANSMPIATWGALTLYADWDGEYLYVATQAAGGLPWDRFVFIGTDLSTPEAAPWFKTGTVADKTLFLGNEQSNNWCGWFDSGENPLSTDVNCTAGVYLEGLVRLETYFGSPLPTEIYVVVGGYETADGGALVLTVPEGNGDGNIDDVEYVEFPLPDHKIDGEPDPNSTEIGSGGGFAFAPGETLHLYADWDGEYLYVATEAVGHTVAKDHFIMLGFSLDDPVAAPWSKTGTVAERYLYLGNEETSNWCGWFDQGDTVVTDWVECASGAYLEGLIKLDQYYGAPPGAVHLAMGVYESADGGALVRQVPDGNADENLDADEYAYYVMDVAGITEPGEIIDVIEIISKPAVMPARPNPFSGTTQLGFALPRPQPVSLEIYDLLGRKVVTLAEGTRGPGRYWLNWDGIDQGGRQIAPGIYLLEFETAGLRQTHKIVVIR
jgi:hypothetical protein